MAATSNANFPAFIYTHPRTAATVTNRSSITTMIKNIKGKVEGRKNVRELLEGSCFGKLIFGIDDETQFSGNIVHHLLLRRVQHDKPDEIAIDIGDEVKVFGATDFADITGLRVDGDLGALVDGTSSLYKKVFKKKRLTLVDVERAYEELDATTDDTTFFRLSLIYMLEVGLLGRVKQRQIDNRHLVLVDKKKQFNRFPWGRVVYNLTMLSLKNGVNTWEITTSDGRAGYEVLGFPYVFQVWAYEHVVGLEQKFANEAPINEGDPIIMKWCNWKRYHFDALKPIFDFLGVDTLDDDDEGKDVGNEGVARKRKKGEDKGEEIEDKKKRKTACKDERNETIVESKSKKKNGPVAPKGQSLGSKAKFDGNDDCGDGGDVQTSLSGDYVGDSGADEQMNIDGCKHCKKMRRTQLKMKKEMKKIHKKVDMLVRHLITDHGPLHNGVGVDVRGHGDAYSSMPSIRRTNERRDSGVIAPGDLGAQKPTVGETLYSGHGEGQSTPHLVQERVVGGIPRTEDQVVEDTPLTEVTVRQVVHLDEEVDHEDRALDKGQYVELYGQMVVYDPRIHEANFSEGVQLANILQLKKVREKSTRNKKPGASCREPWTNPLKGRKKSKAVKEYPLQVPKVDEVMIDVFKKWLLSKTPGKVIMRLVNVEWFEKLATTDQWLDDSHMDCWADFMRTRITVTRIVETVRVSYVNVIFGVNLKSLWIAFNAANRSSRWPKKFKLMDMNCTTLLCGHGRYPSSFPHMPFKHAERVIFAYNHKNHWVAISLELETRVIHIYDSMQSHPCNWDDELHFLVIGLDEVLRHCGREYKQQLPWVIK